jgi:hypothetical protein
MPVHDRSRFESLYSGQPRRVSEQEIRETFVEGWEIQSIEPSRYEVRPDPNDVSFKDGGPKAWFVVAKRV